MPFHYLSHTGDLRAVLRAEDENALFQVATELVRDILVGGSPVEPRETRPLELGDARDGERLFRFLRELAFLYDAEGFLPARFEAGTTPRVSGEPFDPARHHSEHQIKAVTRHGLRYERGDDGVEAEVVFDL